MGKSLKRRMFPGTTNGLGFVMTSRNVHTAVDFGKCKFIYRNLSHQIAKTYLVYFMQ